MKYKKAPLRIFWYVVIPTYTIRGLRKKPYVSAQDHGMLTAQYGEQLYSFAKYDFDSIPNNFVFWVRKRITS
ncbi:hypothetical protein A9C19_20175 [Bacillus weihaiensis]|uniref:Uncharacterized protein n=1 Tax=Bacillus weihaiensis TaxID=1547283 RepID=A0A1L3MWU9_9BACI|nr:hypothetical protein A9C19_20175 [Bacillus weihaiensis]